MKRTSTIKTTRYTPQRGLAIQAYITITGNGPSLTPLIGMYFHASKFHPDVFDRILILLTSKGGFTICVCVTFDGYDGWFSERGVQRACWTERGCPSEFLLPPATPVACTKLGKVASVVTTRAGHCITNCRSRCDMDLSYDARQPMLNGGLGWSVRILNEYQSVGWRLNWRDAITCFYWILTPLSKTRSLCLCRSVMIWAYLHASVLQTRALKIKKGTGVLVRYVHQTAGTEINELKIPGV